MRWAPAISQDEPLRPQRNLRRVLTCEATHQRRGCRSSGRPRSGSRTSDALTYSPVGWPAAGGSCTRVESKAMMSRYLTSECRRVSFAKGTVAS